MDDRGAATLGDTGPVDSEGCARYVVTDVNKEWHAFAGPNVDLLKTVAAQTNAPIVAGGVSTFRADIVSIRGLVGDGVEGAIIGSALCKRAPSPPARGPRCRRPPLSRQADG